MDVFFPTYGRDATNKTLMITGEEKLYMLSLSAKDKAAEERRNALHECDSYRESRMGKKRCPRNDKMHCYFNLGGGLD